MLMLMLILEIMLMLILEVLTRKRTRCNSLKLLADFDESKYTCRTCTSAKISCQYCASCVRVRFDGMRAYIKKQHPDIGLPRGFSRYLYERYGEICSRKYYNFVSFLINNVISIEKVKENVNLLKGIDNFK